MPGGLAVPVTPGSLAVPVMPGSLAVPVMPGSLVVAVIGCPASSCKLCVKSSSLSKRKSSQVCVPSPE